MGDLSSRIAITLSALFGAWMLGHVPVPGAWTSGLGAARLGLAPLVIASTLLALGSLFRSSPSGSAGETSRALVPLALGIALLQAFAVAGQMSEQDRIFGGPGLSPAVSLGLALSMVAGSLVLASLAQLISTRGVGNGLALILAFGLAEDLILRVFAFAAEGLPNSDPRALVLLLTLGWGALLAFWMRQTWSAAILGIPLRPAEASIRLPVAGVGALPMSIAAVVAMTPFTLGLSGSPESLPGSPPGEGAGFLAGATPVFALVFVITAIPAGLLWTTFVFNARAIRPTRLFLFGAPVVAGLLVIEFAALGAPAFVTLLLVPLVATVLDTARQIRVHRALVPLVTDPDLPTCGPCGRPVGKDDPSCPGCGAIYVEGMECAAHAPSEAIGCCVLCARALCEECDHHLGVRHLCVVHKASELVGAWIVVGKPRTRLRAESQAEALRARGIDARVLANTPTGIYGSPGLYDLRDFIPLAVDPRLLGSAIRVLVPVESWRAVVGDPA